MAMKRPLKIVLGIAAVGLVLVVGAAVTLVVMFPPEKVKQLVLPHVEKAVGRPVEVASAGLSFYPVFGVKISGLQVANTVRQGFTEKPFLVLDQLQIGVRVVPLFRKELQIERVVLSGLSLLVETDRTGAYNFDDLAFMKPAEGTGEVKAKKAPSSGVPMLPIPLTMERFVIEKAKVEYFDRKAGRRITLGSIDQRVDFSIDKALRDITSTGELVVSGVSVRTAELTRPLSGFTVTLTHDVGVDLVGGRATIKRVRASLQRIFVEMTGAVTNFNAAPQIALKVTTDRIMIADLLKEVPVELYPDIAKLQAEGFIEMVMDLAGAIDESGIPRLAGHVSFGDGVIRYADLPKAINGLNADIAFTGTSLTVNNFAFNLGENPFVLRATVDDFKQPTVDAELKVTLNLDDLKDVIKLPEGVTLSGIVKSDVTAKGEVDPADPTKLEVKGSVALTNLRTTTPEVTKPILVNGNTDFSNRTIANSVQVRIGASDINLKSDLQDYLGLLAPDSTKTYPRPKLNYRVTSALLNVDEFLAKAPEGGKEGTPPAADVPAAPLLAAPLPGIDMNGEITISKLLYGGVALSNFRTNMSAVRDVVAARTSANLFKGSMSNNLNLDARNISNVAFTNRFNVDRVQLSELVPVARGFFGENAGLHGLVKSLDKLLSGQVSLTTDLSGNGATADDITRTLAGTVEAKLTGGTLKAGALTSSLTEGINKFLKVDVLKINDMSFREMKVQTRIKDEKAYIESLKMPGTQYGDWDAGGAVGFDAGLDMQLTNRLPKGTSQQIVRTLSGVKGGAKKGIADIASAAAKYIGADAANEAASLAGQLVDGAGPVADNEGRVSVAMDLAGTATSPKVKNPRFVRPEGASQAADAAPTPRQTLQQKAGEIKAEVLQKVDDAKAEAQKRLEEERAKAEAEARRKAAEAEQQLKEKAGTVTKDAQKKLKGLLGR